MANDNFLTATGTHSFPIFTTGGGSPWNTISFTIASDHTTSIVPEPYASGEPRKPKTNVEWLDQRVQEMRDYWKE